MLTPPALFLPRPHEQLRDDDISGEAARDKGGRSKWKRLVIGTRFFPRSYLAMETRTAGHHAESEGRASRWRRFSLALSLEGGIDDEIEDDDENDYYCYDYYDEEPPWCFATNQNKENVVWPLLRLNNIKWSIPKNIKTYRHMLVLCKNKILCFVPKIVFSLTYVRRRT